MSDINDQSSDTSSEMNWPLEGSVEQHDRVIFENVADQYVKGDDVTVFFTIISDVKINPAEDQIGILRVGSRNIQECIAFAPVQFSPSLTSGTTRHGTATFPSSKLVVSDDEFYQFCYVVKNEKNLGSSIPFQLNCAADDIDLLSNELIRKTKPNGLIGLVDQDNEDVVVIHTKQMITEDRLRNEIRHLSDLNRRLEADKAESTAKLEALQAKKKEQFDKTYQDMQSLTVSYKSTIEKLTAYKQAEEKLRDQLNNCLASCNQYQTESVQHAQRCLELEEAKSQLTTELNQVRSQLTATAQLAKDQASNILDLQRRLAESTETKQVTNEIQSKLESQLRDLRLTSEKHQLSLRGQLDAHAKKLLEQKDSIETLENEKHALREELDEVKLLNEHLMVETTQARELIGNLQKQSHTAKETAKQEMEVLRTELAELRAMKETHYALQASFDAIKTRCIKHQKSEVDAKKQLNVFKDHANALQHEITELTERLNAGADEYKILFRKYIQLEQMKLAPTQEEPKTMLTNEMPLEEDELFSLLRNINEVPIEKKEEEKAEQSSIPLPSTQSSLADEQTEVQKCPVCYMPFPDNLSIDNKRHHIDQHFED